LGEEAKSVEMKRGFTLRVLAIVCVVTLISGCLLGYSVSYLMAALSSIDAKIEALQVELDTARNTIVSLEDKTTRLEDEISALQITPEEYKKVGFISAPAYDSGWFPIDPNEDIVLTHNLHTTRLLVYLIGRSHYGGPGSPDYMKIHQEDYGWLDWVNGEAGHGCCWDRLDDTTITVRRGGNDEGWAEARVMIWIIKESPA